MIEALNNFSIYLPDAAIMLSATIACGAGGGLIAYASNIWWFRRWTARSPQEDKLADTAHTSLLGFSAFVLALAITNVFSNLAKTEEAVRLETLEIRRLDRELAPLGPSGVEARKALAAYSRDVAADEWPRLARRPNTLSPMAQEDLDAVWRGVRSAQRDLGRADPQVRDALNKYVMQIEQSRESRLAAATNSIPDVFWLAISLFIVAASFMSGRNAHKAFGIQMNVIHMSAIGLVIALIMILDNPFRGQTSVPADIIRTAISG